MSRSKSEPPSCCSTTASSTSRSPVASTELKLYQAFIFSVPIFFTFILLFLFYLFYLRRRRVDWASIRMQASLQDHTVDISRVEMGLKKELREMLPIIVYKESFSVRDTQCPVCLGDYQAEDKLQQIPACGHTFHMDCIDHWLANHITCPLCRLSLLPPVKAPSEPPRNQVETVQESSAAENGEEASVQPRPESCEESQATPLSQSMDEESGTLQNSAGEEQRSECADQGREFGFARNEADEHENSRDSSGTFASSWSEHTHIYTSNFNFQDLRFLTSSFCSGHFLNSTCHVTNKHFNIMTILEIYTCILVFTHIIIVIISGSAMHSCYKPEYRIGQL